MQSRGLGMQIPQILQIKEIFTPVLLCRQGWMVGHLSGALGETLCSSDLQGPGRQLMKVVTVCH